MMSSTARGRLGFVIGQQRVRFADYVDQWRRAARAGLELGYVFDHLVDEARAASTTWFDAYVTLAVLAATTEVVRLGVLVTGASLRHPAHVAKAAATIDHASNGRFELGLGAGGAAADHEFLGAQMPPFEVRVAVLAESLALIRMLVNGGVVSYDGDSVASTGVALEPRPVQAHLPISVGGDHRAIIELAGHEADGWNCYQMPFDLYRERIQILRSAEAVAGREVGSVRPSVVVKLVSATRKARLDAAIGAMAARSDLSFEEVESSVVAGGPDDWVEQLAPLVEVGVRDLIVDLEADEPDTNAELVELLVGEFEPGLSRAAGIPWTRRTRPVA